ncbi:MAG: alpha/beta hydrolase [Clostridiales bacterium]|nr:alpha/beta hydrolase [Clostridiales bacterium]
MSVGRKVKDKMNAFKSEEGEAAVFEQYHHMLEKLEVPYQELSVETPYGNTFVVAAGKTVNLPVVLLHGSGMNSAMWIKDIEELSKEYRVYAIDIPGEPGRSDERQLPLNTDDYVNWLDAAVTGLHVGSAVFVGESLGAWIAVKFAVKRAERVVRLVLFSHADDSLQSNSQDKVPRFMQDFRKLVAGNFNARPEPMPVYSGDELKHLSMPVLLQEGHSLAGLFDDGAA